MEAGVLHQVHEALGARFGEADGREVVRHYGDPGREYAAARSGAVVVDRVDRAVVRMYGRDPVRMIQGLVSNDVAGAAPGQGVYAAMLTAKGKMVADVRVLRRAEGDVLLELDAGAVRAVVEHRKSLLPAGITSVEGTFTAGDPVDLVDEGGRPVARGLVNYDAAELPPLLGRSTKELARELGAAYEREVVHRDDLVVLRR